MEVRYRKKILDLMASGDARARKLLSAWLYETERAAWKNPLDIKARHITADFLAGNRVVFNIGGNRYRLVAEVDYSRQTVLIRWVGYHKDYDRIDATAI